jgi:ferredoxin-NADP reductase
MSTWNDFFNIFNKQPLTFIDSYKEQDDVYTFLFEKPENLDWKPGQHGLFDITHKKIKKKTRPFSIPTTPLENHVQITTKIGAEASEFKQALLELEKGMHIRLSGPVGSFYLNDSTPTLLIAGGMGITPFRAILKNLEQSNDFNIPVHLLYLDSTEKYLFQEDLSSLESFPDISVQYLKEREDLFHEIESFVTQYENEAAYYIAGPTSFVKSVNSHLREQSVTKKQIKKDGFYGYA